MAKKSLGVDTYTITNLQGMRDYNEFPLKTRKCYFCDEVKENCLPKITLLDSFTQKWGTRYVCQECYGKYWYDIQEY